MVLEETKIERGGKQWIAVNANTQNGDGMMRMVRISSMSKGAVWDTARMRKRMKTMAEYIDKNKIDPFFDREHVSCEK